MDYVYVVMVENAPPSAMGMKASVEINNKKTKLLFCKTWTSFNIVCLLLDEFIMFFACDNNIAISVLIRLFVKMTRVQSDDQRFSSP